MDTKKRLTAENPWLHVAKEITDSGWRSPAKSVHPLDEHVTERFNEAMEEERCNVINKGEKRTNRERFRLRLHIPPEPFQGNPLTAEVVILMLNPGFVERCNDDMFNKLPLEEKMVFIKRKCDTMSMLDELCVADDTTPMGKILNDIGERYWIRKLRWVFDEVPDANRKLAVINLLGYVSIDYKAIPRRIFGDSDPKILHTQEFTVRLVKYLMAQNKVLIIRSKKWFKYIPELETYHNAVMLKVPLNPSISPKNCKDAVWDKIINALKK